MDGRILITGAGGFIGGAVARELTLRGQGGRLRAMVHRRPVQVPGGAEVTSVRADLARPETLRGLCDGVDTLVHAAVLIGGDEQASTEVNHEGTAALMREARRGGVRRVIHVSTAAVYGDGPHRSVTETDLRPAPVSPTSRSRLAAEREVLAAGGTVLRPMYILGAGDGWVLPNIWRMTQSLGAWVDGGRTLLSCITVGRLAGILADLAIGDGGVEPGTVYHACHPEPARVRDLVSALAKEAGQRLPAPDLSLSREAALERLPAPTGRHMLRLFAEDHWFDSTRLWSALGTSPGPAPWELIPAYRDWYLPRLREE